MPLRQAPVMVIIDRVYSYQSQVIAGIRHVLQQKKIPLLVHVNDPFAQGAPQSLFRLIRSHRVRGLIVTTMSGEQAHLQIKDLLQQETAIPVVGLACWLARGPLVTAEGAPGMRDLMMHLLRDQNVRRLALVRGVPHHPHSVERESVVRRALAEYDLRLDEGLVVDGRFDRDPAYRSTISLLRRNGHIDAIVALNDVSAMGVLDAVLDHGLRVPEDVIVTGYDNSEISQHSIPPLTTVDQNLVAQGAQCARILVDQCEGRPVPSEVRLPSHLVIRRSSQRVENLPLAAVDSPEMQRAKAELAALDNVLSLNRALMDCRTVPDVMQELTVNLPRMGIGRCFVVLHEPDLAPDGAPMGRVVLAYRGWKRDESPPTELFSADELLPASLRSELEFGTFMLLALSVAAQEFGYVLFEQTVPQQHTGEVLRMDLSRALESITRADQLNRHAEELEQLVTQRTQELRREIGIRREAQSKLQLANSELRRMAHVDGLTRIANRTALDERLQELWPQLRRYDDPLAMIILDVDLFKAYNDLYGHLQGDEALQAVAECLQRAVSGPDDLAARYGGEEFVVLLPGTELPGAMVVANRIRRLLRDTRIPHAGSTVSSLLTISLGIAVGRPGPDDTPIWLLKAADRALYRAKEAGRDRVAVEEPVPVPGPEGTDTASCPDNTPRPGRPARSGDTAQGDGAARAEAAGQTPDPEGAAELRRGDLPLQPAPRSRDTSSSP
jgi:diguanylate cyclase (GGDEF)-like protein